MHARALARGALLALLLLSGCAAPLQFLSNTPVTVETLEGNYRTLAACTYERLARQQSRLRKTEVPDQATIRIGPEQGGWELSFVNDGTGRLTRAEMKSPGTQESDYALALARACSA